MIVVILICALVCAGTCAYILRPVRNMRLAVLVAAAALTAYLVLGSPEIPARPTPAGGQAQADMRLEASLVAALAQNPDDANALVRLAALRTMQGRANAETLTLLERAERIAPDDRRTKIIRSMIEKSEE